MVQITSEISGGTRYHGECYATPIVLAREVGNSLPSFFPSLIHTLSSGSYPITSYDYGKSPMGSSCHPSLSRSSLPLPLPLFFLLGQFGPRGERGFLSSMEGYVND